MSAAVAVHFVPVTFTLSPPGMSPSRSACCSVARAPLERRPGFWGGGPFRHPRQGLDELVLSSVQVPQLFHVQIMQRGQRHLGSRVGNRWKRMIVLAR